MCQASRWFLTAFAVSGVRAMSLVKITRLVLSAALVVSLALSISVERMIPGSSPSAFAQDSSQSQPPPLQRKKTVPEAGEDEDRPRGRTSISVAVDLVSLQVLVTDQKGQAIIGLKPEHFTIYEDNVKQEIAHFASVDADITVVMLVEYSNNISYFRSQIWNAMYTFAAGLRKGDWVAVVAYDLNPTILCDFTRDRRELYEALSRFKFPSFDESNLSDALMDTLDRTQEIEGKVGILLISTGLDTLSRHTYEEALEKCKNANASVFSIGLGQTFRILAESRGLISAIGNLELLMADNRLKYFAEYTGGASYFPRFDTEFPEIFANISDLLRKQYSIAYASTNTAKDGKFRKIRVEVKSGLVDAKGKPLKLKVVTRKGYTAANP